MPKQPSRKKTAERLTKAAGGTEAKRFSFDPFNGSYEKWARETLAGKTGPFKKESAEWFAEGIIRKLDEVHFLLAENAADRAASEAFYLGQICFRWEEIFIRNREEQNRNILFGVMARVANQKRRKKQAAKAAPETAAPHERIKARAATMKGEARSKARILAREFPLSAERIRKII